jgi:guanine nucleotide-binding protein G(i) subunit alpha
MGMCLSSENEESRKSALIDKGIEEDSRRLRRECKILLLGSGESGKSTIVKQMKIIHQNGYTVEELAMYRLTIYKNLVDCARNLVLALQQFDIQPESTTNRVCTGFHPDRHVVLINSNLGLYGIHP